MRVKEAEKEVKMLDPKALDDLLETGWLEDSTSDGTIPRDGSFAWKLKDGAPEEVKKQFEEYKALSEWEYENMMMKYGKADKIVY